MQDIDKNMGSLKVFSAGIPSDTNIADEKCPTSVL